MSYRYKTVLKVCCPMLNYMFRIKHTRLLISTWSNTPFDNTNFIYHHIFCVESWVKRLTPTLIFYNECLLVKMAELIILDVAESCLSRIVLIDWLIDWCLTPTLAVFQLYRDVNRLYKYISTSTRLL